MAMHPALRFLLASLASALAALLAVALAIPLAGMLSTTADTSLAQSLYWTIALLRLVMLVGGIVMLPLAMIAGGTLLAFESGRGQPLPLAGWLGTGLAAGLVVALMLSDNTDPAGRIFIVLLFSASGLLGAWAFRRVWHGRRRADGR